MNALIRNPRLTDPSLPDQQPCARRSSAARLAGVRDRRSPLGKISICHAGRRIEAEKDTATIRSRTNAIEILILKPAAANLRTSSMVNDHSYRSVRGDLSLAGRRQRKGPLDQRPQGRKSKLPEGTTQGEEILCLPSDGSSNCRVAPKQWPNCHAPGAVVSVLKVLGCVPTPPIGPGQKERPQRHRGLRSNALDGTSPVCPHWPAQVSVPRHG